MYKVVLVEILGEVSGIHRSSSSLRRSSREGEDAYEAHCQVSEAEAVSPEDKVVVPVNKFTSCMVVGFGCQARIT